MKIKNIFLAGLSAAALASCSDYLDVDAPSKLDPDYVYTDKKEMNRALNGVYAAMLTTDTYGQAFVEKLMFNTDVEFVTNSNQFATSNSYRRYDCDPDGSDIKKAWDALYKGVERANMLDAGIRNSEIYDEEDSELMQMLGETKVLRAIFYHDLVWYFGDIPFSMVPSYEAESPVYDVVDRTKVLSTLIDDLKEIAPKMTMTTASGFSGGCERIGKEMAWAMIARMALTAGGYSLRPDGSTIGKMERPDNYREFYKIAADYCDSVITKSNHRLDGVSYQDVFVKECNHVVTTGEDPIFEIPFGKESTGNIGYIHGPKMDSSAGSTVHPWGKSSSSAQLNALYRFMFDEDDTRRDFVNQLFYYDSQGVATLNNGRTNYNGKWSKLWNTTGLGATTEGSTGINFPYMRYADVLLMSAEALNEINDGPTQDAIDRYEQVRKRAFPTNTAKVSRYECYGSKEDFLQAILDERKFEFAGENLRWRDLVRNNKLSEVLYWTFFRYFNAAEGNGQFADAVSLYDFNDENAWPDKLMYSLYYYNDVKNDPSYYGESGAQYLPVTQFPQTSSNINVVRILNPYSQPSTTHANTRMMIDGKSTAPARADYMSWLVDDRIPREELLYGLRGYIYCDFNSGLFYIKNQDGQYGSCPVPTSNPDMSALPPVRYILPYPRVVITRSQGKYENKYGYR